MEVGVRGAICVGREVFSKPIFLPVADEGFRGEIILVHLAILLSSVSFCLNEINLKL